MAWSIMQANQENKFTQSTDIEIDQIEKQIIQTTCQIQENNRYITDLQDNMNDKLSQTRLLTCSAYTATTLLNDGREIAGIPKDVITVLKRVAINTYTKLHLAYQYFAANLELKATQTKLKELEEKLRDLKTEQRKILAKRRKGKKRKKMEENKESVATNQYQAKMVMTQQVYNSMPKVPPKRQKLVDQFMQMNINQSRGGLRAGGLMPPATNNQRKNDDIFPPRSSPGNEDDPMELD
jgi:hypothetical protein